MEGMLLCHVVVKQCFGAYVVFHSYLFPAGFVFKHGVTIKPQRYCFLSFLTTPLGLFLGRGTLTGIFQGRCYYSFHRVTRLLWCDRLLKEAAAKEENQKDSVFSVIKDSSNSTIFPVGPYLLWPTIPGWPFSAGIHQNSDTHYVKSSHRAFCGLGEAEAARQPPLAAELSPSVSPHRCSMVGASQHGCSRRVPKTIPHPLGHAKDTQLCANEEEPAQKSPPVVAQARTSISILLSIACLFFSVSSFCFGFAPLLISFLKYPGPNPSF